MALDQYDCYRVDTVCIRATNPLNSIASVDYCSEEIIGSIPTASTKVTNHL
jgi:hypothetical protein